MSAGIATVPGMTGGLNPWRRLRELVGWTLRRHDPAVDSRMGVTRFAAREISLRADLNWEERRCTILHECLHAERGPVTNSLVAREELRVRRETALLLLPDVLAIGEAFAWAHTVSEAAEELRVDVGVLLDRVGVLTPAERAYLTERLEDEWGTRHA